MNRKPPITFEPGPNAAFGFRPLVPPLAPYWLPREQRQCLMQHAAPGVQSVSQSVSRRHLLCARSWLKPSLSPTNHLCVRARVPSGASFPRDFCRDACGSSRTVPGAAEDEREGQTCQAGRSVTQRRLGLRGEAPETVSRWWVAVRSGLLRSSPQSISLCVFLLP